MPLIMASFDKKKIAIAGIFLEKEKIWTESGKYFVDIHFKYK